MNNPILIKEFKKAYEDAFTCECCGEIFTEDMMREDDRCQECYVQSGREEMESRNDND